MQLVAVRKPFDRVMRSSRCMRASVRHESTRRPLTSTVHAPQVPCPQPFLVPVIPRYSRSASSNVTRGSMVNSRRSPFTVSAVATGPGPFEGSRVALGILRSVAGAATGGTPTAAANPGTPARTRNFLRERPGLRSMFTK